MFSRKLAVLALLTIPTIASAQRRTRGDKEANWDEIQKTNPGPKFSSKDIENFSAIKVIVDKRKDLKLSDDQTKQFKELDQKETAKNQPLFTTLDSLRLAMRPRKDISEDEDRARLAIARQDAMHVIAAIRASYDSTLKEGLPLLNETQQKAASELVQKEQEDADENLREKFGGGRAVQSGNPSGGSSRRGRPPTTD